MTQDHPAANPYTSRQLKPTGWGDVLGLLMVLLLGLSVTWYGYKSAKDARALRQKEKLVAVGQSIIDAFDLDLLRSVEAVRATGLMVANENPLKRDKFNGFARGMASKIRTMSYLQWQPLVARNKLAAFEAAARKEGLLEYQVLEPGGQRFVPAKVRDEYVPILYSEPETNAPLGLDMAFGQESMATKNLAAEQGSPAASESFFILERDASDEKALGITIVAAVRGGVGQGHPAIETEAVRGYVTGVFKVEDIFHEAAFRADAAQIDMLVFDQGSEPVKLIYSALEKPASLPEILQVLARNIDNTAANNLRMTVNVATRPWDIVMLPRTGFYDQMTGGGGTFVLWGGVVATLLLVFALYRIQRSRRLIEVSQTVTLAAEQKLAVERQRLSNILEGTDAGTWKIDLKNGATRFNERLASMLGYPVAEMEAGGIEAWRKRVHADDLALIDGVVESYKIGKIEHFSIEVRFQHKDRHWLWVLLRGRPFASNSSGKSRWMAGIQLDISEQKLKDLQLEAAKETAEAASRLKSEFLANMSHEIRTPMNGILGMLKLLEHTELNSRQLDYASKAQSATRALLGIINDILDFSKVEAGKMDLDCYEFVLGDQLHELSVMLSANLGNKGVEMLFSIDPSLPPVLLGDALRLRQVLLNLCSNALKFTEEGMVVLGLKKMDHVDTHALAGRTVIEFSVKDSGIGIAEEKLKYIFEGFSQAEASTTRRFGGTGLGLAICKKLVELMGGTLQVESELGKGSRFFFQIGFDIPVTETANSVASAIQNDENPLRHLRVLIVDDNSMAREVLQGIAHSMGWETTSLASGEEALALLENPSCEEFQVILMDWRMPGIDGWETTRRLRQLKRSGKSPVVIMVTAHDRQILAEKVKSETDILNGYLFKPVTASMLHDAVLDATTADIAVTTTGAEKPRQRLPASENRLSGLHLLLVEDNALNQQVAQELLKRNGASVDIANNGLEGVEKVRRGQYDLVLMDIQMPVMDGLEATRQIRNLPGFESLPIVAMTANAMDSDHQTSMAAGMNDHITKPIDLKQLLDTVVRWAQPAESPVLAPVLAPTLAPVLAEPLPVASSESPLVVTDNELPNFPGLDANLGLLRVGGSKSLYVRLLREFLDAHRSDVQQAGEAIAAERQLDAQRIAHTLKGNAATLGAQSLSESAAALESALRDDRKEAIPAVMAALTPALETFCDHLSIYFHALDFAKSTPSETHLTMPSEVDSTALIGGLEQLLDLLAAGDATAEERVAELSASAQQTPWASALDAIAHDIDDVEFTRALLRTNQLLKKLSAQG